MPLSLSPAIIQSHGERRATKTEVHPNAIKNIKNLPILYGGFNFKTDTSTNTSHEEEEEEEEGPTLSSFNYRSLSTLDFRTLHTQNIAKLLLPQDKDTC